MNAIDLLTTRRSNKQLRAPAPDEAQLDIILQAGTQVPDHGHLTPWHFTVIQSEQGLTRFRQLLDDTVQQLNLGDDARIKAQQVGHMAPMIIAVTFRPNHHAPKPKPEWEQLLSAACAAYAIELAAKAQGFDHVWITGLWVNSPLLREALHCGEKDKIIGLIMLGTADKDTAKAKNTELAQFVSHW